MKERPILFSGRLVRRILADEKTQTRRILRAMSAKQSEWLTPALLSRVPAAGLCEVDGALGAQLEHPLGGPLGWVRCPYGKPGDRLWVREAHHICPHCEDRFVAFKAGGWMRGPSGAPDDGGDRDDDDPLPLRRKCAAHGWRPSIHMPRWASRLTLEVTDVRVERLQEITEDDARAEGVELGEPMPATINGEPGQVAVFDVRKAFQLLWDTVNRDRASWASNPWVWVVSFRRVS